MTEFHYIDKNQYNIGATLFPTLKKNETKPLIIYLHGGGLIYGSRFDLPKSSLSKITNEGYDILALDYPLMPESSFKNLVDSLSEGINWGIKQFTNKERGFILFGRSAGAYLSLLLSSHYLVSKPKAIISFYGYYNLLDSELSKPSSYYNTYPTLDEQTIQPLINIEVLFNAPIEQRFPLYLAYRQQGSWISRLSSSFTTITDISLTEKEIQTLPPLFIAASKDDNDIPFSQSYELDQLAKESVFYTVHDLPHDFDRFTENPQTQTVYANLINWLNQLN